MEGKHDMNDICFFFPLSAGFSPTQIPKHHTKCCHHAWDDTGSIFLGPGGPGHSHWLLAWFSQKLIWDLHPAPGPAPALDVNQQLDKVQTLLLGTRNSLLQHTGN